MTAELVQAQDLVVALDYGQFSLVAAEPNGDVDPAQLLNDALEGDGIAQGNGITVILSPHQNNFRMPFRVERWSAAPMNDDDSWDEAFAFSLHVVDRLAYDSPTVQTAWIDMPSGQYTARVTGRGFVARGWPGTTTPGDEWRLRLWPERGEPVAARRIKAWDGLLRGEPDPAPDPAPEPQAEPQAAPAPGRAAPTSAIDARLQMGPLGVVIPPGITPELLERHLQRPVEG